MKKNEHIPDDEEVVPEGEEDLDYRRPFGDTHLGQALGVAAMIFATGAALAIFIWAAGSNLHP